MISEKIKEVLQNRVERSSLNFKELVRLLDESNANIISGDVFNAIGVCTIDHIYLSVDKINNIDDEYLFFTLLHEYCHYLRISKIGEGGIIGLLSETDYPVFVENIIKEEIIADRYARLVYYILNKKLYPLYRTQMLFKADKRHTYEELHLEGLYGLIKDRESYDEVIMGNIKNIE